MVASFTHSASHAADALWRVLSWPARVGAARRTMSELARMSEYELRDIGLTRSDLNDATALPARRRPVRPARQAAGLAGTGGRRTGRSRGLIEAAGEPAECDDRPSPRAAKRSRRFPQRPRPPFRRDFMTAHSAVARVEINARPGGRQAEILSAEALAFLAGLHRRFNRQRLELLVRRMGRQEDFDAGKLPDFLPETKSIRDGDWRVAPIPADLLDRRVEITGPVDRKMIVNALNSGAKVFMADFEDATSPMFANMVEGQANLKDRWAGKIDFTDPATGKTYALRSDPAVLMVRPRGWHLPERHVPSTARKCRARCSISASMSSIAPRRKWRRRDARLLSAEAREPPRGAAVERCLRLRRATNSARRRNVQGDGADRDAARGVRDGRNPLRAARPYRRAQLRPLGLYFLVHQAARQEPRLPDPRPRGDGDGQGVPQRLFAAADQDLPPPRRVRDGRHGGADSGQGRHRAPTRRRSPRCAPTRSARPATATTAPGSRIPISCRSHARSSTG